MTNKGPEHESTEKYANNQPSHYLGANALNPNGGINASSSSLFSLKLLFDRKLKKNFYQYHSSLK